MIGKLKGVVDAIGPEWMIVDVAGVGYKVFASAKTLRTMPAEGETVELMIETHVREDHIHLYGFLSADEQDMFNLLLEVQGVGTRVALAILTVLAPFELQAALASGDTGAISQAQGVGPKLAARIINELKSRLGEPLAAAPGKKGEPTPRDATFRDALSALVHLGYKPSQAHMALLAAARKAGEGANVEALVKAGLKELSG